MVQVLHGRATTTAAIRRAIQHSQESLRVLAARYGINQKMVAKWKKRTAITDLPTGPKDAKSTVLSGEEEVGKEAFDLGRIKVIFRALKLAKPPEAVSYILANFGELIVFAKEVTLLMEALVGDDPGCFDSLSDDVVNAILAPPASSIQLVKTWLLELFVRGVIPINAAGLKKLDGLSSPLDRRQLHLIRGRVGDKVFFRKMKTGFGQISVMEQPCFVWGASCLPKVEFETWLTTAKPMFVRPTGGLFLKWTQQQRDKLINKLEAATDDHQE